jgi:predicted peptidase
VRARTKAKPAALGVQCSQTLERTLVEAIRLRYLLFLPRQHNTRRTARWPLILFLHGAGERGENLSRVASHGPPKLVKSRPDFPFVVASPLCPAGQHWRADILLALLDELLERFPVDASRVYLTGLSMGGYGTWALASACPERFAAAAPICGGGETLPILLAETRKLRTLRSLPIWAFHGARDDVVPLHESERMVKAMRDIGNNPRFTVYPEAEHDVWTETYQTPALFDWFLAHRRRRS